MTTPSNVLPHTTIPVVLSGQLVQIIGQDKPADILIQGIPFLLKPSQEHPFVRQMQEDQREQFDNSKEAGENSFGDWWLRSQATFHGGQGQKFLDSDPQIADVSRTRYFSSRYAYPHAPGELTVAGVLTSTAGSRKGAEQVTWSGTQRLVTMSTSTFTIDVAPLPGLGSPTTVTLGATGVPTAMTTDGANIWVAIADKIYRINTSGVATQIYNATFSGPVMLGFAKQRLILAIANKLYELDPNPAAPPVALPAAHYTNPSTGYIYTSVTEGPNGIYVSGYSGPKSDVSMMSVTESASTVVLGPPIVQLRFPPGELVNAVFFYLGSKFAIATTFGVHVGEFTPYGQPQAGPLMIGGTPCYALSGSGTLIYVAARDSIWWIDLSTPVDKAGVYSHAMYADGLGSSGTDPVNAVTVYYDGTRDLTFGTTAAGRLVSQPTYVQTQPATMVTSWARFSTVEPKQLHYISVDGVMPAGTVKAETSSGQSVTFSLDGLSNKVEFSTASLPASQTFRLTFTLTSGTLRSYQLKALATPQRYAEVILPLSCFNYETPSDGRPQYGYNGFAVDRVLAVEDLARQSAKLTITDKVTNTSYAAVIKQVQFQQDLAPEKVGRFGGILNVALKAV